MSVLFNTSLKSLLLKFAEIKTFSSVLVDQYIGLLDFRKITLYSHQIAR